mmetsp:Transcript_5979/g.14156  ORF Transcript_5979/g.14156 Transcript_5979/m.14156 type:complete len:195 (-) Transcript_5979:241-825(-)
MVLFTLYIRADLEHVSSVALAPGADLCISVRNPLSPDTEVREKVVIETGADLMDPGVVHVDAAKHEIAKREPPCHFALKWDGAQNRSTIQVLSLESKDATTTGKKGKKGNHHHHQDSVQPRAMKEEDSGNFVPIVSLECNGLEPYAFHPLGGEFVITNKNGDTFEDVDLSEGAWSSVDLASGSTAITNFEAKFE